MEPDRCPLTPRAWVGSNPESPQQNGSPVSRISPAPERHISATSSNEPIASPRPNCPICLERMKNQSFTDSCLHEFCFMCLLKWSKVRPECPLCKQGFKSIIHNVRSIEDYDEYHLHPGTRDPDPWNSSVNLEIVQRFRYRTTVTRDRRVEVVVENMERDLQRRVEPGDFIPTYETWHLQRRAASFDFRVRVYTENLWVNSLPIIGRPRDISPQHLRRHPEEMERMVPWLTRELYAILRAPRFSSLALEHVLSLLPCHDIHSVQFWSGMEGHLRSHCDHFIHEFYSFARSPYDMIGFDGYASYSKRNNTLMNVVLEVSSDSSDSDIIILPTDDSQTPSAVHGKNNSLVRHRPASPVAGPSRAILPIDEPSLSEASSDNSLENGTSLTAGLHDLTSRSKVGEALASHWSDGSDSGSCEFVGYIKPLHERTPEVISLLSSDTGDDVKGSSLMGTVLYDKRYISDIALSSSTESSGSEYNPHTVHKSQTKKVSQKEKCDGKGKIKKCRKGGSKTAVAATKKQVSKPVYSSSDSDSSVSSCNGKRSCSRRKARSSSNCSSASGYSSSSRPTYISQKSRGSRSGYNTRHSLRNEKGSWRIKIKVPDVKQELGYSVLGRDSRNCTDNTVHSVNRYNSRPRLRSIVIRQAANGTGKCQTPMDSFDSSHKPQKKTTKKGQSCKQIGAVTKVKDELIKVEDEFSASPSTSASSSLHHKSSSQASHSSHRYEGRSRYSSNSRNRQKHSRKDKRKVKTKRQKDSDSSTEQMSNGLKLKKRKRIISSSSDSSDD